MRLKLDSLTGLGMSLALLGTVLPPEGRNLVERGSIVLMVWSESLNAAAPEANLPTGLSGYENQLFSLPSSFPSSLSPFFHFSRVNQNSDIVH